MSRIGLKLWSNNVDNYLKEAIRLYSEKKIDFVELYIVPGTLNNIDKWKETNIPFTIHATHSVHNVNLANSDNYEINKTIYIEIKKYFEDLSAKFIVVHAGLNGSLIESVKQLKELEKLKIIDHNNVLIENKPFITPLGEPRITVGSTIEQIKYIINEFKCGFCLDISHAICTANHLSIDPYKYIEEFLKFEPKCYHICDGDINSEIDKHMHLSDGNYDLGIIKKIINSNMHIALETKKDSIDNLKDFEHDISIYAKF